jgi:hypothetical protein
VHAKVVIFVFICVWFAALGAAVDVHISMLGGGAGLKTRSPCSPPWQWHQMLIASTNGGNIFF